MSDAPPPAVPEKEVEMTEEERAKRAAKNKAKKEKKKEKKKEGGGGGGTGEQAHNIPENEEAMRKQLQQVMMPSMTHCTRFSSFFANSLHICLSLK